MSLLTRCREYLNKCDLEYRRSLPITLTISIPYSDVNMNALREIHKANGGKLTVLRTTQKIRIGIQEIFPGVEGIKITCTSNPNWVK